MPSGAVVVFTRDLRVDRPPCVGTGGARVTTSSSRCSCSTTPSSPARSTDRTAPGSCSSRSPISTPRCASLGGRLVTRRGDWVDDASCGSANDVGAAAVHVSDDVSAYARELGSAGSRPRPVPPASTSHRAPGMTVVEPGAVTPGDAGDHYKVFTPYYRRWSDVRRRAVGGRPAAHRRSRPTSTPARSPSSPTSSSGDRSPDVVPGRRAGPPTGSSTPGSSAPSAPTPTATTTSPATRPPGSRPTCTSGACHRSRWRAPPAGTRAPSAFLRQLCWRDFYLQVLAARPDAAWSDYQPRGDRWRDDPDGLRAWQEGRTGYPVVDAAMRQLRQEGFDAQPGPA